MVSDKALQMTSPCVVCVTVAHTTGRLMLCVCQQHTAPCYSRPYLAAETRYRASHATLSSAYVTPTQNPVQP